MRRVFTGLLDKNCKRIYEGDFIRAGMRRDTFRGWSTERVVRRRSKLASLFFNEQWSDWCLVNECGERMDMQLDQELRELVTAQQTQGKEDK